MNAHGFLTALTIVLGVAAVTTVLFKRLGQPVVLGYILAGLIVGPNVPIPVAADRAVIQTLSELGVILLMFSLGLEFSFGKLWRLAPRAGLIALLQSSLMVWLGFLAGRFFGWSNIESVFAGGIIAISSTTIIAKAFDEQGIRGRTRELVVGVLIVEDLIAILFLATLTAFGSGSGLTPSEMALAMGRLAAFLLALVVVGLLVVPRAIRFVRRLGSAETTLVASVGLCFGVALLAQEIGYSVALGAFIAGSLVAESGEAESIEDLVWPVRDLFAAIFFVSVGMLIDPVLIARHWVVIAVLTTLVIVGKIFGVTVGSFLTGYSVRTSVRAGMSLAQIGEFSFIIASLGLAIGATDPSMYAVAVAVSAITTLTTPWLIRASDPVSNLIDRNMPGTLQTFVALYGSWLEGIRSAPFGAGAASAIRRLVVLLIVDAGLLAGLTIGIAVAMERLASVVETRFGLSAFVAHAAVVVIAIVLAAPLCLGIVRVAGRLGALIGEAALPRPNEGRVDLALAPRRTLVLTVQLAIVLLTGSLLMVVMQPFLGGVWLAALLAIALVGLGVGLWRGAEELHGHVRAGAQMIVEALLTHARSGADPAEAPRESAHTGDELLREVRPLLPGLGEPISVELPAGGRAIGKTIAQIHLRGLTGATILAIRRGEQGLAVPAAKEVLQVGDILVIAGTHEAIEAAQGLLTELESPP